MALTSFLCGINSKYHCVALQPPPKNTGEAKRRCQEHDNLLQTKQYKEFLITKSKPQTNKPVRPNFFSNNGQRPSMAVQELTNNESEPTNESSTEKVANPFDSYYSEA
ncbi:unnamed protein product [Acanthoscelides obtectus]|uniref:Uncharacterized protein n=1 Tax=Acanthoscelides obtectus TaxID=200917 RepID=A0A9P0PWJ2_ACAOB|nr:unnamed protein product [Acanthoscelides obtectus]CAK1627587.1 hypothetical protein AOBTE_LOCUS4684 [Acanthoscelides obtectus]